MGGGPDERGILYSAISRAWSESKGHTVEFESKVADEIALNRVLNSDVTVFHYSGYGELTDENMSITAERRAVRDAMQLPEGIASPVDKSKLPKIAVLSSSRDVDLRALGNQLVEAGITHVVIMKAHLELIKWFSDTFYKQLLAGESVRTAFDAARNECANDEEDATRLFLLGNGHEVSYFTYTPLIDDQPGVFKDRTKIVNWCRSISAFSSYESFVGRNLALHTAYDHLLGMKV